MSLKPQMWGDLETITFLDIESGLHDSAMLTAMRSGNDDRVSHPASPDVGPPGIASPGVASPDVASSLSGVTHTSTDSALGPSLSRDAQSPPFPNQLRNPQRYEFLGEHGRGGLGRVSRVHDRELGRDVAIKELLSRGTVDEVRFLREVLITARLEHPGIVPVHEAGRWPDGTPYYAMKLVSGRSLRELIAERTTVEQRIGLLHHVIAVADAIAYAHGRNIIHRDLKPANVIVGDFGETIVIDWGLAKDLTSSEESAVDGGPFRTSPSDDLTATGCVLGTPAYMAPEQKRGDTVDQRADVFAIGTMLWELCSLQRTPPTRLRPRHKMLRRAGIDQDLIAILDKALDPVADHRYPHAGALAADLKAFKSGARVAARSYSLPALLAHWTRHHRALALSTFVALAIAITASLLYVRNIAAERDRADTLKEEADAARLNVQASLDKATLDKGQLHLTTDPSATIDDLATYRGADIGRAKQITAEAFGRGVAPMRAVPHTSNVLWTQGMPDGAVLSLGFDGIIVRTSPDGVSTVIARGVSKRSRSSYSPTRHLLAYTCDPSDVCLLDVPRSTVLPVADALRGATAIALSFSSDGNLLAVLSQEGLLRVLDVADPARPAQRLQKVIAQSVDTEFVSDDVVAVGHTTGVELVRLSGPSESFALANIARWATNDDDRRLALATKQGQGVIVQSHPVHVAARADLCRGPVAGLQFIPHRRSVAYACRDGAVGIWDPSRATVEPRAQLEGHADMLATSPSGEYVIAAGGNGIVAVLDLETQLIAYYKGHGFRLTSMSPPSPESPFVVSGDVRGGVRAWPLPPRYAKVAAVAGSALHTAIFDRDASTVVAASWLPELAVSSSSGMRRLAPHERSNGFLARSSDGLMFASYGLQNIIEVWSLETLTRTRVFASGHGSVSDLAFVEGSHDFITAGHDGRLLRWTDSAHPILLAKLDRPLDGFAETSTASIVLSSADGALWRTRSNEPPEVLRSGGSRINRLRAASQQPVVYAGYANGDVVAVDTTSWQLDTILHDAGTVREIALTSNGRTIAVATNDGSLHVGIRLDGKASWASATWSKLAMRARHISMAADGLLLASCTDGTIWLYSTVQQEWLCLFTGTADLGRTTISADGRAAVVLDFEGRMIRIDLDEARTLLEAQRARSQSNLLR
jgi:eukaryotic-like serine/threonine-protein kinase